MKYYYINGNNLTVEKSNDIINSGKKIKLTRDSEKKIKASRKLVEKWINTGEIVYGITTGFGEFKDIRISKKDTEKLQRNLILSHSAGVGKYIPTEIVKLMLLFRINSLAKGYSGVRLELLNYLTDIFNKDITPVIPSKGSVGSSGDLSPLSHLSLVLIGMGMSIYKNKIYPSGKVLKMAGKTPFKLSSKEGLALIEFLCSFQALEFLKPYKPGTGVMKGYQIIRKHIQPIEEDVLISDEIHKVHNLIYNESFLNSIESITGKLEY